MCRMQSLLLTPTQLRQAAWRWGFALGFLCSIEHAKAQFVNLTTEIQTVLWVYHGTNKPPTVQTKSWTTQCVVGTNTWLIEGEFFPARHAWWFTGSNIVAHSVLRAYPSERKELFEQSFPEMRIGRGHTEIIQSKHGLGPYAPALVAGTDPNGVAANIAWLAFCSGDYLKGADRRIPLPSRDFWSYGITYTANTTVFEDDLGLPKAMDFYATNAQPVFRYRVVESTNILDWSFPLEFQLAQYRNEYGEGPWELNFTASGKVISIGIGGPPQIPTESQKVIEKDSAKNSDGAGRDLPLLMLGSSTASGTAGAHDAEN